jgi:hypothetical protein
MQQLGHRVVQRAVSLRLSKGKRLGRRRKFALRVLLIYDTKSHHMLWPRVCGLHIKYPQRQILAQKVIEVSLAL